jgi:hypothetical protein
MLACPCCRGICNCRSCLRNGLPRMQLAPHTAEQQLRHSRHVLRLVAPHVAALLATQDREVRRGCRMGCGNAGRPHETHSLPLHPNPPHRSAPPLCLPPPGGGRRRDAGGGAPRARRGARARDLQRVRRDDLRPARPLPRLLLGRVLRVLRRRPRRGGRRRRQAVPEQGRRLRGAAAAGAAAGGRRAQRHARNRVGERADVRAPGPDRSR